MQKSIRFFIIIFPAFLALVKPLSTMAKPHCIKNTSAAPIKNQTPNTLSETADKIESLIVFPPIVVSSKAEYSPKSGILSQSEVVKAGGVPPFQEERTG